MYSWYPSDVLNIPRCTHGIPPHSSWYPPMYWTSPDILMISPRCTHDTPDVLNTPRCTEHPPMYWTHIIQGEKRWTRGGLTSMQFVPWTMIFWRTKFYVLLSSVSSVYTTIMIFCMLIRAHTISNRKVISVCYDLSLPRIMVELHKVKPLLNRHLLHNRILPGSKLPKLRNIALPDHFYTVFRRPR